ncbi:MAG: aminoacyl-tRNA hydrolase [Puniceicoccales bacterium]|jgi:PTH1 family peptidyl-tRNA hydrolase|nr:aminoacyl-tRNA hydrolase [Puniceicoccales bacterium]
MARDVVVGLGNEGSAYRHTRHNLGAYFVEYCVDSSLSEKLPWQQVDERLACRWARTECGGQCVCFLRPMGFMNESGVGLRRWLSFFRKSAGELILCCDDITLPLGALKISFRPGTAGHHGVESVWEHVGPGFVRFRLGIGPKRHPEMDLKDHVLGHFSEEEQACVEAHLPLWRRELELLLDKDRNPPMKVS